MSNAMVFFSIEHEVEVRLQYVVGNRLATCHCQVNHLSFYLKLLEVAWKRTCSVACALSTLFEEAGVMLSM